MKRNDPFLVYKQFVNQRDKVLDRIYNKYRLRISDILRDFFTSAIEQIMASKNHPSLQLSLQAPEMIYRQIQDMRRVVAKFTTSSELEILSRITGKPMSVQTVQQKPDKLPSGAQTYLRIELELKKIVQRLSHAAQLKWAKDEDVTPEDLIQLLPRTKTIDGMRSPLFKVREAKKQKEEPINISIDPVNDQEWDEILDLYKKEFVPNGRDPETYFFGGKTRKKEDRVYGWELENDITQDFVEQVRAGQIDAAQKNGITDFVWIAIVDDRTDDCCLWRDGLTTKEIEVQLRTKRKGDECQVTVPPAHFNCRCTLAPATENLPSVPESNIGEFETWLDS